MKFIRLLKCRLCFTEINPPDDMFDELYYKRCECGGIRDVVHKTVQPISLSADESLTINITWEMRF